MLKNGINDLLVKKQKSQSVIVAQPDPIEGTSDTIKPKPKIIISPDKVYDYFKHKYTNNEDITNRDMKELVDNAADLGSSTHSNSVSKYPTIYKDYNECIKKLYRFLYLVNFCEDIDDNKFILAPELTNAYKIIKIISDYFMLYIEISLYVIRYHYIRALYYENEIADYGSFIVNIFKLLYMIIWISVIINNNDRKTNIYKDLGKQITNIDDFKKELLNFETYEELCRVSLIVNEKSHSFREKNDKLIILLNSKTTKFGGNKFKSTKNKITVIYKKKQYTRVIYISERKKYVKINKTYLLLSKLQKI
jgi:hypothetical protein